MPITPPPASIRQSLAESSKAAAAISPDTGFGSRAARPMEEPGKSGTWSGDCQITSIDVKWDDTFTIQRGDTRDSDKTVPAASVSLSLVTRLENNTPVSWTTKRYRWVHGDINTLLPESPGDNVRRRARDDMAVIMGWIQGILGTSSTDPVVRDLPTAAQAIDAMIQQRNAEGSGLLVKAGYVKTVEEFTYKKGPKKGTKGTSENVTDYVYKNLVEAAATNG